MSDLNTYQALAITIIVSVVALTQITVVREER